jgi:hypothetical protein
MAGQDITIPEMDDGELFAQASADTPAEPVVETKPDETPRDELGRFAPKDEAEAKPAEAKPEAKAEEPKPAEQADDKDGQVPSWRLRELRLERDDFAKRADEASRNAHSLQSRMQQMERELSQLKAPKQEPVDFFADPNAAFKQQIAPIEQQFNQLASELRLDSSKAMAIALHGAKAVTEMEAAVEKAMAENNPDIMQLAAQMRSSKDPVSLAMKWHQRSKLWETTGGDPEAYRQRILDDALKNPEFQAKVIEAARGQAQPTNGTRPNIQMPPSLNRIPGSGTSTAAQDSDDVSDRALFEHAVR